MNFDVGAVYDRSRDPGGVELFRIIYYVNMFNVASLDMCIGLTRLLLRFCLDRVTSSAHQSGSGPSSRCTPSLLPRSYCEFVRFAWF